MVDIGIGYGASSDGFESMFFLIAFLIIGIIVVTFVRSFLMWNQNNHSPRLTVDAKVVSKRIDVSHYHHGDVSDHHTSSSTSYYVTFQVESGDRIELKMNGKDYGLLVEGDQGKLSFQGTRYLGFERL